MLAGKGQASMIDILILTLIVSALFVFVYVLPNAADTALESRGEAAYNRAVLSSLLNWTNATYGPYYNAFNNKAGVSFGQAADLYFCCNKGDACFGKLGPKEKDVEERLEVSAADFLNKTARNEFYYILFTDFTNPAGKQRQLIAYNNQSDVCSSSLIVTSFNLNLTCSTSDKPLAFQYAQWRIGKDVKRAADCERVTTTT
ncbi:MAG: hypothetical protein HY362_02680 [Candidatus Aenigmarchaeota archaeon]|nr:hypothetical protein [Candidatus Aenigmarchaeota archaeon]